MRVIRRVTGYATLYTGTAPPREAGEFLPLPPRRPAQAPRAPDEPHVAPRPPDRHELVIEEGDAAPLPVLRVAVRVLVVPEHAVNRTTHLAPHRVDDLDEG